MFVVFLLKRILIAAKVNLFYKCRGFDISAKKNQQSFADFFLIPYIRKY